MTPAASTSTALGLPAGPRGSGLPGVRRRWHGLTQAIGLALTLAASAGPSPAFARTLDEAPDGAATLADAPPLAYDAKRFTSDDGLPQTLISGIAQTRDGYLWLGTWVGLVRYDGLRFTVFDRHNTPDFRERDAVRSIVVDEHDRLWIGAERGLLRMEKDGFREFVGIGGQRARDIDDLSPAQGGGVWLMGASAHGRPLLARFRDGDVLPLPAPGEREGLGRLFEHPEGPVAFLAWRRGQLVAHGQTEPGQPWKRIAHVPGSQPRMHELGFAGWVPGGFRMVTAEGLVLVDLAGSPRRLPLPRGLLQRGIVSVRVAGPEAVVFTDREGGLWLQRPGDAQPVAIASAARMPDGITAAWMDREDTLWIGARDGLWRLQRRSVGTVHAAHDAEASAMAESEDVHTVAADAEGRLWTAGRLGVAWHHRGEGQRLPPPPGQHLREFQAALVTTDGRLLGAHESGIHEWQGHAWRRLASTPGTVVALFEDRRRRLWAAGTGGAGWWTPDGWTWWNSPGDLGTHGVRVIHQTRDGTLWFGTRHGGLVRFQESHNAWRRFGKAEGMLGDEVWALHETPDGLLWVGSNQGLHCLLPGTESGKGVPAGDLVVRAITTSEGLRENAVNWILVDDQDRFWLSGLQGVHCVPRQDLEAVARRRASWVRCTSYGVADGLEIPETNGENQPAGARTPDGRLWFPTGRGLVEIDPRAATLREVPPRVVLEEARFDDAVLPVLDDTPLRLEPGRSRLVRFRYTAPTFRHPERARFRHRLLGLSDAWHDVGGERTAYFTNLKPGDYVFEVTAANAQGIWAAAPARLAFRQEPGFTQRPWFPFGVALVGLGVVVAIAQWHLGWQRRTALAEERARIARDLHDDLGTALSGVALELDVLRKGEPAPMATRLAETSGRVRALAGRMREVVWAVNPKCDTVPSLALFLEQHAASFLRAAGLECRLDFPDDLPVLPLASEVRQQLSLGVREALANVVAHAHARRVTLGLVIRPEALQVTVADDGRGFDASMQPRPGHGLSNLRTRLARLGGRFDCHSRPGGGTSVVFSVPLRPRRRIP